MNGNQCKSSQRLRVCVQGYAPAPAMYSAPPSAGEPAKEAIKMENMAASPADPLLTSNAQVVTQTHIQTNIQPRSVRV